MNPLQAIADLVQGLFGLIVFAVVTIAIALFYLAPALLAGRRQHRDSGAIFVVNVFLGWTVIGWVAALAWAMTGNVEHQDAMRH